MDQGLGLELTLHGLHKEDYPPGVLPVRTPWGGVVFRMPLVNLPPGRMAGVLRPLTDLLDG